MAIQEQQFSILDRFQEEMERNLDALSQHVWGGKQLKQLLKNMEAIQPILSMSYMTANDIIKFLIMKSRLTKVKFNTPRTEALYCWRHINEYELMPVLRPNGYYTHLSALYFHELLDCEPKSIYFNYEQAARAQLAGDLEQKRIDNAFQKKQRLTTAKTVFDGKEYWLLNGKQTGNYGVILMKFPGGVVFPVTDLERTLIDITVRPAYAGGVNLVLKTYRTSQPRVSIEKLLKTLSVLNYVYPYHQSIGFYMEMAGNYSAGDIQALADYATFKHHFYLDYEMKDPMFSQKWKIHYPRNLT